MVRAVRACRSRTLTVKPWLDQIQTWRKTHPLAYDQKPDGPIKPQFVVEEIYRLTRGKAIVTTEVGQNQMWAAQYYLMTQPRTFITSGGLGCMGFWFSPRPWAPQVARPEKTVIDIAGDGSIQMNIQELATVLEYNLPVKVAILNNHFFGYGSSVAAAVLRQTLCATPMNCAP